MFRRLKNWIETRKEFLAECKAEERAQEEAEQQKHNAEIVLRIENLIKAANTTEPAALAAYLVSQGICDEEEVEEREEDAFIEGYAAGED